MLLIHRISIEVERHLLLLIHHLLLLQLLLHLLHHHKLLLLLLLLLCHNITSTHHTGAIVSHHHGVESAGVRTELVEVESIVVIVVRYLVVHYWIETHRVDGASHEGIADCAGLEVVGIRWETSLVLLRHLLLVLLGHWLGDRRGLSWIVSVE